jgi:hypothetical protein
MQFKKGCGQNHAAIYVPAAGGGGGGEGTVLFDAVNFAVHDGVGATSASNQAPITPGSGSNGSTNLALIVAVQFIGGIATGSNPTVAVNTLGTSVPSIGSISGHSAGEIYLFGLTNPWTGAPHGFDISWTGGNQVQVMAFTAVGADQTGGSTTFVVTSAFGNSTSASTGALTSPSNRICIAAFSDGGGSGFTATGNTDIGHDDTGNVSSAAACYDVHNTNPTLSYGLGSNPWNALGVSIKGA